MGVVTAGVHHRHILAVEFTTRLGGEWDPGPLQHRQAVHIRPQCNHRSWLAADQGADHTRMCDACLDLVQAETSQVLGDFRRGPEFTIRELRVLVNVPPPFDDLRFNRRECFIQGGFKVLCRRGCAHHCKA